MTCRHVLNIVLVMCFFASLGGCNNGEQKDSAGKTGHGHSHD
ncbi:MAG: hypothetical protein ACI8WM_002120 [Burkholderiaceae bacterium]|jgi:hypothetical protein